MVRSFGRIQKGFGVKDFLDCEQSFVFLWDNGARDSNFASGELRGTRAQARDVIIRNRNQNRALHYSKEKITTARSLQIFGGFAVFSGTLNPNQRALWAVSCCIFPIVQCCIIVILTLSSGGSKKLKYYRANPKTVNTRIIFGMLLCC